MNIVSRFNFLLFIHHYVYIKMSIEFCNSDTRITNASFVQQRIEISRSLVQICLAHACCHNTPGVASL